MSSFWSFLGRFCISAIFLFSAANKILHWEETEKYFEASMMQWQQYTAATPKAHDFFSFLLPLQPILLLIATIFEGLGGLLLFLGVRLKAAATLLILFVLPVTILMHPFWMVTGAAEAQMQMVMFLKNLGILGGLFILLGAGSGQKSK